MKKWLFGLLIICLGVLQLSPIGILNFFNLKPDLLLIACLASVFFFRFKYAFLISIFCGLFKDAFLVYPATLNTISFAAWSYIIFRVAKEISTDNILVKVGLVFLVALLQNIIMAVLSSYYGVISLGIYLRVIIFASIYTAFVSPLIFILSKKILDR
ncbi:MAG: hypothetical protein M0Q96_01825 [Candidatus Omnitrophica bacterium]|jgi:rod shape-determining protein MreD|nr:hypothetical protein [Candidatus Omnitrophota bacterium]